MFRLSLLPSRAACTAAVTLAFCACDYIEGGAVQRREEDRGSVPVRSAAAPLVNPFLRSRLLTAGDTCVTLTIDMRGNEPAAEVEMVNRCDYPVAVLTSPLEVRIRSTGTEVWSNEHAFGDTYAILYVLARSLGKSVFRQQEMAIDGGLAVKRPPGYTSVGAHATVRVPLRCGDDVRGEDHVLSLWTYEAALGGAPPSHGQFDCSESVERHNAGQAEGKRLTCGGDAREIYSTALLSRSPATNDAGKTELRQRE